MILSYVDILGDGQRHKISAEITTDHPASSYGQPVIVLPDGNPLDVSSWLLLAYQVEQITPTEFEGLQKWLAWLDIATEQPGTSDAAISAVMSRIGSIKTERKAQASRDNGRKGGRPRKPKAD